MGKKTGCVIGLEGSHLSGHTLPWRPLTSGTLHGSVLVLSRLGSLPTIWRRWQSMPSCQIFRGHQTGGKWQRKTFLKWNMAQENIN